MADTHKIPQNVTTYEGRIIGKFTAKQFIFLAIGAIIIFLILSSELPGQIQLISGAVVGGVTLIFSLVNIQGRTTDEWISNFVNTAQAPTQRIWKKFPTPYPFMLPTYHPPHKKIGPRQRTQGELERFIEMWEPTRTTSDYTDEEKESLKRLRQLREGSQPKANLPFEELNLRSDIQSETDGNITAPISPDSIPDTPETPLAESEEVLDNSMENNVEKDEIETPNTMKQDQIPTQT